MRCVIVQPSYLPWRGAFALLATADVHVTYDCVQYDARGWRNRNRIKTAQGPAWLTVPVHRRGVQQDGTPVHAVSIDRARDWRTQHLRTIRHAYARAPHRDYLLDLLEHALPHEAEHLVSVTVPATQTLADALGVRTARHVRSSQLAGVQGTRTDRLLSVLLAVGATTYVSGPSARDYLDVSLLARHGITTEWMVYDSTPYPQLHGAFDAHVSVLDLIAMTGPDAAQHVRGRTMLATGAEASAA
jgi:hypothetical protein